MNDRIRVLYAEDDPRDAALTRRRLAQDAPECDVDIVDTGRACLDRLAQHDYDLLLVDYRLPDMDGLEIARTLMRQGVGLPVVLITGAGDEDVVVQAIRSGVSDYISKRGDYLVALPQALRRIVEAYRGKSKTGRSLMPVRRRILYVEHDPSDVELTVRHFAQTAPHLTVQAAWSGVEALDLLQAAKERRETDPYDLVLTDLHMPDMSALDLFREAQHRGISLPFVIVTGKGDEDVAVAALKMGARDYVVKREGYLIQLPYVIDNAIAHFQLEQEIAEHTRTEESLQVRVRQQAAVAEIGSFTLSGADLEQVFDKAVATIVRTLDVELCKILELLPDQSALRLRAGVGWQAGLVGQAMVPNDRYSQAGYTLLMNEPVIVRDLQTETRFQGPPLLFDHGVVSGLSVKIVGPDGPFGVLGAHTTSPRTFTTDDVYFLQAMANVLAGAVVRKHAERSVAASERQRRAILEGVEEGIHGLDLTGHIMFENRAALKMFGWQPQEMLGRHSHTLIHHHRADGSPYPAEECLIYRTLHDGKTRHVDNEVFFRQDGTSFPVEYTVSALRDDGGALAGAVVSFRDVTESRRAETERRESEERFRQLAETIREVFWLTDPSRNRMLYVSPAYEEIWGRSLESLYASPHDWAEAIQPEDRSRVFEASQTKEASGTYDEVYRIIRPDGTLRWIRDRAFPIRDASGTVYRIAGIAEDITELKQLEAQFLQSQKLEAVGELAGGIAHDFNNNLSAILGFSDLALDTLRPGDPLYRYITQVKKAGEQSATLTRQLLAFSRKQLLQPKILDLNALMTDEQMMLQRIMGEHIQFRLMLHPELGRVKADPGQIEQVLMNLVVNARDAMPEGGTLTLQTGNVECNEAEAGARPPMLAGSYIRLTAADTGCGMNAEIQARIFEPFFTTKEIGKGTGLGLSTVYGIIKQSGGYIWVDSTPGQGTTFTIDLPRVEAPLEATPVPEVSTPSRRGDATVLLVEDDELVRTIARETLQAHGYTVLEAMNGGAALLISERHQGTIDLLLTDVVMPYMSGPELAQRLTTQRPDIRVLYMSGYTDDRLAPQGVLRPDVAFLAKPFTPDLLLRTVQGVLEPPENRAGVA